MRRHGHDTGVMARPGYRTGPFAAARPLPDRCRWRRGRRTVGTRGLAARLGGDGVTTMRDVASLAGVSLKTVSRVFNDDPGMMPQTRQRVEWAMHELGYVPNMLATAFRLGHDRVVAVAVPDIADPFFAELTRGVEEIALAHGLVVMVTSLGRVPGNERPALEAVLNRRVMGLIAVPTDADQSYLVPWQKHTPMVFVDRVPTGITADSVVVDDVGGARQATDHLLSFGHRRIAFVGDSLRVATTRNRLGGYRSALTHRGLEPDPRLVTLTMEGDDAAGLLRRAGRAEPPTAVFSSNIRATLQVIQAMRDAAIPELPVVGFGDFLAAPLLRPGITVVDQAPARVGRIAVDRVLLRATTPGLDVPHEITLGVRLRVRGSGACPERPTAHDPPRTTHHRQALGTGITTK